MIVNKTGGHFKSWTHRIIFENYEKYIKSREITQEKDGLEKNENKIIQFIGYNGPAVQMHATKKLLTPYLVFQSETLNDFDEISRDKFKEQFGNLTFYELIKHFQSISSNLNSETLSHNLVSKLGIAYFSGRAVNLKLNYSQNDILNILNGIKVDNVQKGAKLNTSFNSNKGIIDQIEFENFLRRNKFKFISKRKIFTLKLYDHKKNLEILIELDENLNFIKAASGKEKSFNIDYLRDRRNSIDKASGTFLDIFDLRFQYSSNKNLKRDELLDLLSISSNESNVLNELVKISADGQDFRINEIIGRKFKYFRESDTRIFSIPSKNDPTDLWLSFNKYFTINITKVVEYNRKERDNCHESFKFDDEDLEQENAKKNIQPTDIDEIIIEKKLIANSTVYCDFDINKWLLSWNKTDFDEDLFRETLVNIGQYLFDQMIEFSNEIFKINNNFISSSFNTRSSSSQSSNGWLLDLIETKSNRVKPKSTVKIFYQNKLVDQESFSFLKKVVYSKTFLEIFDLNLKTAAELEDGNLDSFYKSIQTKLNLYVIASQKNENRQEASIPNENESKGLVKVAIRKLNDAYNILNCKNKRENYLKNLKSLRKYKKVTRYEN